MKLVSNHKLNNEDSMRLRECRRLTRDAQIVLSGLKTFSNWHRLLTSQIAYRFRQNSSIVVKLHAWNGCKFKVRMEDIASVYEVWLFREYFHKGFRLPDRATVVDIGASIGLFTLYVATEYPSAKIFAYEPVPENFFLLIDNILMNRYGEHVKVFNVAISTTEGERTLLYPKTRHHASSFFAKNDAGIICKTVTLEDILAEVGEVDFLKMDVEGSEFEVLLNTKRYVLRKIRTVALEYHDDLTIHNHNEICEFLNNNGYKTEILQERGTTGIIFASRRG